MLFLFYFHLIVFIIYYNMIDICIYILFILIVVDMCRRDFAVIADCSFIWHIIIIIIISARLTAYIYTFLCEIVKFSFVCQLKFLLSKIQRRDSCC